MTGRGRKPVDIRYFSFYTQANVFCILIFAVLLINDWFHSAPQNKQLWFTRTVWVHILYFLSDIGWAATDAGLLLPGHFFSLLFNFTNYVLLSLIAYEWFMYMAAAENMMLASSRRRRMVCRLPLLISAAALVTVYLLNPDWLTDERGNPGLWYYLMMVFVPVIYILASFIRSLLNAAKAENRQDRHLYLIIGIYPLGVVLFGMLQTFAWQAPLFCCGCTLMMLFFYIQNMQTQVSLDPLTRLNNRGQIDRYMSQIRGRENQRIYVLMIDVDRFKEINDSYGHTEGDRALVLVAESLRQAVEQIQAPVFLGRYGGDEFTVFVQTEEEREYIDQLVYRIRYALREKQVMNSLPYKLNISIGYALLSGGEESLADCLVRADEKLYEDKRTTE